MLDEELKEDELSDGEEPAAPEVEPDDTQPASVSNKYTNLLLYSYFLTLVRLIHVLLQIYRSILEWGKGVRLMTKYHGKNYFYVKLGRVGTTAQGLSL